MGTVIALAGLLLVQDPAAETAARLREYVEFLASDDLAGRDAGHEGNRRAAEWIAERFAEAGLEAPFGEDGFMQYFEFRRQRIANVVGVLRGRTREIVLVGAHFDHIGRARTPRDGDDIYNGADDNASGTAVLVEVARRIAARERRPRRTIVFAAWNGEERGLVGSRHYAQHPLAPLEQHAAAVNLDMLGRNPDRPVQIDGVGTAAGQIFRTILDEAAREAGLEIRPLSLGDILDANTDHWPFFSRRIPTVSFFTGYHDDYHGLRDHADRLAYDRMARIAQVVERLVVELAGRRGPIVWQPPFGVREAAAVSAEERARWNFPDGAGAVRLGPVAQDTVLARAGVREGDVLVAWDGEPLDAADPVEDTIRRSERTPPGGRARLTILREGRTLDVEARW